MSNTSRQEDYDNDCYHDTGPSNTLRSVVEDLYHGLSGWGVEYAVQITQAEDEGDAHGEEHDRVKSDGTSDYQWDRQ